MSKTWRVTKCKLIRDGLDPAETLCLPINNPAVHAALLIAKLHEEIQEVAGDITDAREYADVLQALKDLAALSGVAWKEVETHLVLKAERRGGFSGGKIMVVKGWSA